MSTHTKGEHMIEAMNLLNVDAACVGNNNIAMGVDNAARLFKKTDCSWVLSNVYDPTNDDNPICGVESFKVINH